MKNIRRTLAGLALLFTAMLGLAPAAQAACYVYAPTTGYVNGWYVHYYSCKGPYLAQHYPPNYRYYCFADFGWQAEWFGGEVDRWVWAWGVTRCYA